MPKESWQGINTISQHIQYLVDQGGEDVVGFSTDFDGFAIPLDDLDNASLMGRLIQRLGADGYSEARNKKVMGAKPCAPCMRAGVKNKRLRRIFSPTDPVLNVQVHLGRHT